MLAEFGAGDSGVSRMDNVPVVLSLAIWEELTNTL